MPDDESNQGSNDSASAVRLVLIADRRTINDYGVLFRHLLFGLSAQSVNTAFVVPPNMVLGSQLWPNVEIITHPALKFALLWKQNHKKLLASLEKFKPTVVHCFGTSKASLAKSVAKHFGIGSVISLDSLTSSVLPFHRLPGGFGRIIVPSASIAEIIKKHNHKTAHLVKHIKAGTFVDESCACFSQPQRLPSMIVVHRSRNFKDFEPLLSAIRHLAVDGYEFLAVFMGPGKAGRTIRSFVKSVGLGQVVNVSAEVKPLRFVFRGADIYIQPRKVNGFSPVLTEAASCGLAVAACKSDRGELLRVGQTAVFFDPSDELSIYSTLQKLLDDRQSAVNIAKGLQDYLRNNYTVSGMVNELLDVYQQA